MPDIIGVYHDVEPHWSTQKSHGFITLVYVTAGKVIYEVDDRTMVLDKGEGMYIPRHMNRAWTSHPLESHTKFTAVFSWDAGASGPEGLLSDQDEWFRFRIRNAIYFERRFLYLFTQWLSMRTLSKQMSNHVLQELILLIAQEKLEKSSSSKDRIAGKLQEYILNHYRRNITIGELAAIAEITPSYVTVLFKKVTGVTPIQYMHHIRINKALHLLQNTPMTIGEVSDYLGYCDQAYFNRTFKKWMGTAPVHVKS